MNQTIAFEPGRWYVIEAMLRNIYGFPQEVRQAKKSGSENVTERIYGGVVCLRSDDTIEFVGNPNLEERSKLVELATAL